MASKGHSRTRAQAVWLQSLYFQPHTVSAWTGPHSLERQKSPCQSTTELTNMALHAARGPHASHVRADASPCHAHGLCESVHMCTGNLLSATRPPLSPLRFGWYSLSPALSHFQRPWVSMSERESITDFVGSETNGSLLTGIRGSVPHHSLAQK